MNNVDIRERERERERHGKFRLIVLFLFGVFLILMILRIDFISAENIATTNYSGSFILNNTFTQESFQKFVWSWNQINYTFYDESLLLMLGFDNRSSLGEGITNVKDVSIYNQNGTISTTNYWIVGQTSNALDFNGSRYVNLSENIYFSSSDNWTIMFWANKNSGGGVANGMVIGDITKNNLIWLRTDLFLRFKNSVAAQADFSITSFSGWHHYAFVANGTALSFYLDGNLNETKAIVTSFNITHIGRAYDPSYGYDFDGYLDDIGIYNITLSSSQINDTYQRGVSGLGNNIYEGLIGYWPFNESSGNISYDFSGNANNGLLINFSDPISSDRFTSGKFGNSYSFDGTSNYITFTSNAFNVTENISISLWLYLNGILDDNYSSLIRKGTGAYQFFSSDTNSRVFCGDGSGWIRTTEKILIPGRWNYLACVINGTNVSIYSNVKPDPIYTIGDSITAGHGGSNAHCTSSDNCAFSAGENINHTYQYWLDNYMNSYSSVESTTSSYYNKGHGSQSCDDIYARFNTDVANNSEVILMCGINDLADGDNSTEVEQDIEQIYNLSQEKNNNLIIMEILPYGNGMYCENITLINSWLSNFVTTHENVSLILVHDELSNGVSCYINSSLFEDNAHPTVEGYKEMARQIWRQYYNSTIYGLSSQKTESYGTWDGINTFNEGNLFLGTKETHSDYFLDGKIDELRIYNRSLSYFEISQNYFSNLNKVNNSAWNFLYNNSNLTGNNSYQIFLTNSSGEFSFIDKTNLIFNLSVNFSDFSGISTNLTSGINLANLTNLILEKPSYGRINFSEQIGFFRDVDIDSNIELSNFNVYLNSTALPELNKSATITLYNVGLLNPIILRDGVVCPNTICTEVSYSEKNYTFTVIGFSNYSLEETPPSAEASTSTSDSGSGSFTGTFKPSKESLQNGYSMNLGENQKVEIPVVAGDVAKTVIVKSIGEDEVSVSVGGESYDIAEGGTIKIDSNGDGYYDIEVENIGISGNYVNLKFTLINEEIPKNEEEGKGSLVGEIIDEIPNVKEKWYVYAIMGVVVLGLILYLIWNKYKMKKRYKKYGY